MKFRIREKLLEWQNVKYRYLKVPENVAVYLLTLLLLHILTLAFIVY